MHPDAHTQDALLSRPFFHSHQQKEQGVRCEACKRNHTASFVVTLTGAPYDSEALWAGTLSPLEYLALERPKNPDSAEEDNGDQVSFQLGSHCHKRANLFHQLAHYKAALIGLIHVCAISSLSHHLSSRRHSEQKRIEFVERRMPSPADAALIVNTLLDDNDWCSHVCPPQFLIPLHAVCDVCFQTLPLVSEV